MDSRIVSHKLISSKRGKESVRQTMALKVEKAVAISFTESEREVINAKLEKLDLFVSEDYGLNKLMKRAAILGLDAFEQECIERLEVAHKRFEEAKAKQKRGKSE